MKSKLPMLIIYGALCFSLDIYEQNAFAAAVETVGELKTSGGIRFSDDSLQTSACSGCAELVPIERGGTGANNATQARTNLDVPGLQTPNTFTANQTVQGDITAGGNLIFPATSVTTGIIKSGDSNLIHAYGSHNFFAGINAGNLTMTGAYNTAIGDEALHANTSGYWNTAVGPALHSNTTGHCNTAIGQIALDWNSVGSHNTAVGEGALNGNRTSDYNTAIGSGALYTQSFINGGSTWSSKNTAVGYMALYHNQPTSTDNGVNNTAVGYFSLTMNSTGYGNTAVGVSALEINPSGFNNTATGYYALRGNSTGYYNTADGVSALYANEGGHSNTASGYRALYANTEGDYNTAVGRAAGETNTTGNNNTFLGYNADASANNLTNATAIGYNASVTTSNMVRIGNESVTVIEGHVNMTATSDIRLKKDVGDIVQGLDFVNSLRPVQYRLKDGNERIDFGFIAQDIEALLGTGYNVLGIGNDKDRTLSLRYTDFIAPMVKAIQEQQEMIEQLKAEVAELKRMLAEQ